ncbi:sulfur oxidation c-type cytochrome SoxX [Chlorobaculum sp. 24CR]|uniref:sulfur oxidation c-type cytochrome SoxX n=1 Tax=Chlorobaculum sp. 24CR TaxID=2508878 RepID=UPI00100A8494|nr:sulfur oxidation c-type cytochrome SoxX [Chlorobaculum sp. 24CR]RXK87896.1 sulfur oxidation c-type cytochrome SoxX [Chlorobaculum sp. 24CR]
MKHFSGIIAAAALLMLPSLGQAASKADLDKGKALAFDSGKGNCLACHTIADGEFPGNFGPPLIQMKERFPDHAVLRQQIWDASAKNPKSMMPPFGKNGILTEPEIDQIVDYLYTL